MKQLRLSFIVAACLVLTAPTFSQTVVPGTSCKAAVDTTPGDPPDPESFESCTDLTCVVSDWFLTKCITNTTPPGSCTASGIYYGFQDVTANQLSSWTDCLVVSSSIRSCYKYDVPCWKARYVEFTTYSFRDCELDGTHCSFVALPHVCWEVTTFTAPSPVVIGPFYPRYEALVDCVD